MLLTIAKDPKLLRLLPYRSVSSPNRTSKKQQMTTRSTYRLALLYIIFTTHFISQTCISHPLMRRCDASTYNNKNLMPTMYSKKMSSAVERQQSETAHMCPTTPCNNQAPKSRYTNKHEQHNTNGIQPITKQAKQR